MVDNGYVAISLVNFCIGQTCYPPGEAMCPKFKSAECDLLKEKKEEFTNRLITMYKHDVIDIGMFNYVMHELCDVCPDLKSCRKRGDFRCTEAKVSILGMKSDGKHFSEVKEE